MIGFLKKLWNDFRSKESSPGYWTSCGDIPVFVYGGDPLSTVVIYESKIAKIPESSQEPT